MHTLGATPLHVNSLFAKLAHGHAMTQVTRLDLCPLEGIKTDLSPSGRSPRQVLIAMAKSLRAQEITPGDSRTNIVLDGDSSEALASGALVMIDGAAIRVTFACEPCAHGAQMAEVLMSRFRRIERYLGVVLQAGEIIEEDPARIHAGVFEAVPCDFRTRCTWALDSIPPGRIVTSLDFLTAVGAARSYLRVLPRWMQAASHAGRPAHRVLTTQLDAPSWARDADALLSAEGLTREDYAAARYPLADALWFDHLTT
ncbi:MAG: MOSC domain-containing protein [Egibacteraceae bacterium]